MARKINDEKLLQMLEKGVEQKAIASHFGVSPAAVTKRKQYLERTRPPKSFEGLTEKERQFAFRMAEGKSQTMAAMETYECSSMASAKSIGSEVAKREHVQEAISDLMNQEGLTRRYRVQRLKSHVDCKDPGISLKGIDLANRMEGLYSEEKPTMFLNPITQIAIRFEQSLPPIIRGKGVDLIHEKNNQEGNEEAKD